MVNTWKVNKYRSHDLRAYVEFCLHFKIWQALPVQCPSVGTAYEIYELVLNLIGIATLISTVKSIKFTKYNNDFSCQVDWDCYTDIYTDIHFTCYDGAPCVS